MCHVVTGYYDPLWLPENEGIVFIQESLLIGYSNRYLEEHYNQKWLLLRICWHHRRFTHHRFEAARFVCRHVLYDWEISTWNGRSLCPFYEQTWGISDHRGKSHRLMFLLKKAVRIVFGFKLKLARSHYTNIQTFEFAKNWCTKFIMGYLWCFDPCSIKSNDLYFNFTCQVNQYHNPI